MCSRWRLGGRCYGSSIADNGDDRTDLNRVALLGADLGQRPRNRRRHLGVDFVGRDLEERLVLSHLITHSLEPLGNRAFGDGFTELREGDVCHVRVLCP